MTTLPCKHLERIVFQVEPTKNLLSRMDQLHPEILVQHGIEPLDYHGGLVFRSAIESIRGRYIASSKNFRQNMVGDVLSNLLSANKISGYADLSNEDRYDFQIILSEGVYAAIEVKGGEGNSINISRRPIWAKEFGIWCHLDGAIVNEPAHGATAVVNRVTNALVRDQKRVDFVLFKDVLCGTRTRPCPKYDELGAQTGLLTAPDIFLFPQRIPIFDLEDPERHDESPPPHTLDSLQLPNLILDIFAVPESERERHIWYVQVTVEAVDSSRRRRVTEIFHQGQMVGRLKSRPFIEGNDPR